VLHTDPPSALLTRALLEGAAKTVPSCAATAVAACRGKRVGLHVRPRSSLLKSPAFQDPA
jgi:hypothetical protein